MPKTIDWFIDKNHILKLKQYFTEDIVTKNGAYFNQYFSKEVVDMLYYEMYRRTKIRKNYILNGIIHYMMKHIIERVVIRGEIFVFPDGQTKMYIGKFKSSTKLHFKNTTENKIKKNILKNTNYKVFIKNPNFEYEYYFKLSDYYRIKVGQNIKLGLYGV